MKKSVVSFIAGFLFAIGVSAAYAEIESMIGKKIDGQFPLKVNGEFSEVPAITVEGKSYIPLRAAGELFGARVSWLDGEVIMETTEQKQNRPSQPSEDLNEIARQEQEKLLRETEAKNEIARQVSVLRGEIQMLQFKITKLKQEIENREEGLKQMPEYIEVTRDGAIPYEGSDLQKKHQEDLAKLKAELADLEAKLAELEQQKAELEQQLETP